MEEQQGSSSSTLDVRLRIRNHDDDSSVGLEDYEHGTTGASGLLTAQQLIQRHRQEEQDRRQRKKDNGGTDTDSCYPTDTETISDYDRLMEMRRRRVAASERFIITNKKVFAALRSETEARCGPSTSVLQARKTRELGSAGRNAIYSNNLAQRIQLNNRFFPNCRKVVDKLRTKMFCCQYVKDGSQLVIASQDEHIRFYEYCGLGSRPLKTRSLKVLNVGWSILDVAMAADGRSFAYGTWKDAVIYSQLCEHSPDTPDGLSFTSLHIPNAENPIAVFSVRFSENQDEVVAGVSDRAIHVFDLNTQSRVVGIENAHQDDVNAVCYGDVGSHLIYSGGDDGIVKVWDRRSLGESDSRPVGLFAGHHDGITYIDSRGDNRFLISNSKDQSIKLWDLRKFSSETAVMETVQTVARQSWDYRWQPAPSSQHERIAGDTSILTLRGHSVLHTLIRAKFSPHSTGQRYVYTGCAKGAIVVYDLLTGGVSRRLPGHTAVVREASWNPNGHEIASCGWDGVAAIWKWDERRDHITGEAVYMGDEDSCDEMYCVERRRKLAKSKCKKRRAGGLSKPSNDSE